MRPSSESRFILFIYFHLNPYINTLIALQRDFDQSVEPLAVSANLTMNSFFDVIS